MSNSTSLSEEASASSGTTRVLVQDLGYLGPMLQSISCVTTTHQESKKIKKKRSLPGNPDPDAEVISLSPRTLLATNRFVCEICNKGFQRDQNLQLHRRGHNLPWKLKQRNNKEVKKKAYVCPEQSCVHHHPSRALGDLTGIKKHFCRKHGEKKFKCEKCSKIYAVYSDWKAHSKTCGTREYRCDCGTLFSRKDSFVTHRAFCDALAEESARLSATRTPPLHHPQTPFPPALAVFPWEAPAANNNNYPQNPNNNPCNSIKHELINHLSTSPIHISSQSRSSSSSLPLATSSHLSATALLQKACTIGAVSCFPTQSQMAPTHQSIGSVNGFGPFGHVSDDVVPTGIPATWQKSDHFMTRDFLGLSGGHQLHQYTTVGGHVDVSMSMHDVLKYAGGLEYAGGTTSATRQGFGFAASETWGDC
ncbi:hypothetical protein V2J09_004987 [Rumex salicifolius]